MKLCIITVGKPKLAYAKQGWEEYFSRLARMHQLEPISIADKYAYDAKKILQAASDTTIVALEINGKSYSSQALADFLLARELEGYAVSFIIGGPEGLPEEVRTAAHYQISLSQLTLPHDLAMVLLLEALYRASTINAHLPYHK